MLLSCVEVGAVLVWFFLLVLTKIKKALNY